MRDWDEHARLVTHLGRDLEKRRKDLITEAAGDDELDPERLSESDELDTDGLGQTELSRARAS